MENQENVEQFYKKATRKAKTNLVWFGIFSIVMLFAGLTSAYIVQKGDIFWVKFPLPVGLWISTAIILVSSITMILAVKTAKSKNNKKTMLFLIITLLLGIAFTVSQFSAWNKLIDNGYRLTEKIFHPDTEEFLMNGEYGKDFTIEFQGNPLIQENDGFHFWGEQAIKIDKEEYTELKNENPEMAFGKEFIRVQETTKKKKTVYEAVLYSKMKLSPNYFAKLKDMSNVSSSHFYVLTAVHLLHILVTLLYLINMIILTGRKELTEDNQLKIKLGGYFWHFFAGLWVYLLLFLFLIH
ncbi:MAG: cytochrome c oxidase subunit 3 [Flavobacteriales bacterium]